MIKKMVVLSVDITEKQGVTALHPAYLHQGKGHPFWMSFFLCNFWTKTRSNRSFFCLLTIENVDNRQWKLSLRWSGACCGNRGCGGIRGGTSWNGYSGDASNDERLSQPAVYGHRIIGGKTFQKKSFAPNLDISLQL